MFAISYTLYKIIATAVACPGIRKRGARKPESLFFCFSIFQGGPAQKIADKIIFPTKKVAKYR